MKKKNKINFWVTLPKCLHEDILKLNLTKINKDKAVKFVAYILKANSRDNYDSLRFREIPTNYIRKVYGCRYLLDFLRPLIENNIIERNSFYSYKNKSTDQGTSKSYRINNDYLHNNLELVSTNYSSNEYHNLSTIPIFYTVSCNMLHRFSNVALSSLKCNFDLSMRCREIGISVMKNLQTPVLLNQFPKNDATLRTFEKAVFNDMFDSLTYNFKRMEDEVKSVVDKISVNDFKKIDSNVDDQTFEVYDRFSGNSAWVKKETVLRSIKQNGHTLIQDKDNYYIDDLDRYVETKKKNILLSYNTSIAAIKKRIYSVNRHPTNWRLNSVFTSMYKGTFNIIKADNDLVEIDLVNSQYAIFANWLMKQCCYKDSDVKKFCSLAIGGRLYEYLVEQLKLDPQQGLTIKEREEELERAREVAKKIMMAVAFSSWKYKSTNKAAFKRLFPNVYDFIESYNKVNKDGFAVELQNKESRIFIDGIMPILLDKGLFVLTKHDSLVIRREDKEVVVNIVKTYFDVINLKSSIKVGGELIQNGVSECQILEETEKEDICQAIEPQEEIGYQNQLPIKEEPTNKKAFCKWTATEAEK